MRKLALWWRRIVARRALPDVTARRNGSADDERVRRVAKDEGKGHREQGAG